MLTTMNPGLRARLLIAGLSLLPAAGAHAVRAADTPPPAPELIRAQDHVGTASALGRAGQITAAEAGSDLIEIDGVGYRVVEGRTQVFRQGRPVALGLLAKGLRVQFKVSPGGHGVPVLGVVHAK